MKGKILAPSPRLLRKKSRTPPTPARSAVLPAAARGEGGRGENSPPHRKMHRSAYCNRRPNVLM